VVSTASGWPLWATHTGLGMFAGGVCRNVVVVVLAAVVVGRCVVVFTVPVVDRCVIVVVCVIGRCVVVTDCVWCPYVVTCL
jgi:hypothetical protein